MKTYLILVALCVVTTQMSGYDAKKYFMKGPGKEFQHALENCTYYTKTAADSGLDYKCVMLTPRERDSIIQRLKKNPKIINSIIDDKLITQLTTPLNDENKTLKQVLIDFEGRTVKKVLGKLEKMSTMQKLADVLSHMRQDY